MDYQVGFRWLQRALREVIRVLNNFRRTSEGFLEVSWGFKGDCMRISRELQRCF